ncbi:hypothetical protein C2S52_008436 [Perilla frutescens var. hirtella]|nr:hypothetical protein C2S51_017843 [Perilla frutescens var. frutescens]KAH6783477.1 hypothetical protein C2S52_008436 [Perilla frutescens var. hirtella]
MAEISSQLQEKQKEGLEADMATPDLHNVSMKIQRAQHMYKASGVIEEKPTKGEILGWYLYGLCSYFVHTVLIPIVFPLIISQTVSQPPPPPQGWLKSYKDVKCKQSEMLLYEELVHRAIKLGGKNFSPLEWTSISWFTGLILSAPILGIVSILLDYSHYQQLIAGAATIIGALFCLPAGFFKKSWIFPPYIAVIVAANTIVGAAHARHLGLMIRGFTGSIIPRQQFANRRSFGSWLSLYSTAAGCLGAAIMSSFTYHMFSHSDHFTALWVVSIFSGLKWGLGMFHIFSTDRATTTYNDSPSNSAPMTHVVSIFRYPHAAGSLAGVFLSSFITMCIFGAGLIHAMGYICTDTKTILFLWLTYFMVPIISLPLVHPVQQAMKLDAEKMQLLGFILSTLTSGFGFYYKGALWTKGHLLFFAAVQGTATGLLHAFGRVLWLDCSPAGKEGAFSVWFSWVRALGACAGFAVATSLPGNVGRAFGASFCVGIVGMVVLIFGNISSFRGARAAGHVTKSEKNSPVRQFDDDHSKSSVLSEVLTKGRAEV